MIKKVSAREIAYLALLAARKEERFIHSTLAMWMADYAPTARDIQLAKEIAYGSCRMALALDALAMACTTSGKLSLKAKEKALLHTALYQYYYLERIPLYAIANETMEIANRHCHLTFSKFLNVLMRKLQTISLASLPQGFSSQEISIRYSYPLFFVERLKANYSDDSLLNILDAGNHPADTVFRVRGSNHCQTLPPQSYSYIEGSNQRSAKLLEAQAFQQVVTSPDFYVQNATPTALMYSMYEHTKVEPKRLLDLCASPGGKLLLAHDLFRQAALFANDVTLPKIDKLKENLQKYGLSAVLTCENGQSYSSTELFDLIVIDAPCSNSGVLNKRPEARWRLTAPRLQESADLQLQLLTNAVRQLSANGEIWYLTCSILKEENEWLIKKACQTLNLYVRMEKTILPTCDGWDGGYGCILAKEPA